jgi:HD-like signal output (HDOD) protein
MKKRALSLCIEEAEKKVFGFDHQELGAEVLKSWGYTESRYEFTRYHHRDRDILNKLQSA